MNCPRCDTPLIEVTVDEVVLDRCEECGGLWFDFALLERVLNRESRALRSLSPKGASERPETWEPPDCPRCADKLIKMRAKHEPIVYYGCLTCYGRWLDGTEMDRIVGRTLMAKFEKLFQQLLD